MLPGTEEKILLLQQRAMREEELHQDGDPVYRENIMGGFIVPEVSDRVFSQKEMEDEEMGA